MRSCPKCGSYVPEGKLCCPACGRLNVGVSKTMRDRTQSERRQTQVKINDAMREVKRDTPLAKRTPNPFSGGTYEQHKSHDPRSKDYYKSKHETGSEQSVMMQRVMCAAAYFGILFIIPLAAMPNSKEAKFHANQGLVLFLLEILLGAVAAATTMVLGDVFSVLNAVCPVLMVYGAVNAMKGNMTELPLIGKLRILKNYNEF